MGILYLCVLVLRSQFSTLGLAWSSFGIHLCFVGVAIWICLRESVQQLEMLIYIYSSRLMRSSLTLKRLSLFRRTPVDFLQ